MKTLFVTLGIIATTMALIFAFLPMGSIAILPAFVAAIFSFLAFRLTEPKTTFIKVLLGLGVFLLIFGVGKTLFSSEEVVIEEAYEEKMEASKEEALQDLEELEELEIELDSIEE
tara:strand:+ start:1006 stop:1350 length:345 start_codon:yes stop_codon:yes gene_type:complete